tara:strand:- start:2371 stop:2793 length:423 start_codon:yes stop_codon:yes gene_type:complete
MADKKIKIRKRIKNIFGRPHLFVQQDAVTGNPVIDPDDPQKYLVGQGGTLDLIERLIEQTPRWAFQKNDSEHMSNIMLAINHSRELKFLTLAEDDYYWLGELVERQMPPTEGVDPDTLPTVGMAVWGSNEAHFISLLGTK